VIADHDFVRERLPVQNWGRVDFTFAEARP
jgi:hypothetical protein